MSWSLLDSQHRVGHRRSGQWIGINPAKCRVLLESIMKIYWQTEVAKKLEFQAEGLAWRNPRRKSMA